MRESASPSIRMYTSVCIHLYVYICMYAAVCIHLYVYSCMYTSVCIHLYVYICLGNLSRKRISTPPSAEQKNQICIPPSKTASKQLFLSTILKLFGLGRPMALFGICCSPLSSWATRLYVHVCMYVRLYVYICMYTSVCIHTDESIPILYVQIRMYC